MHAWTMAAAAVLHVHCRRPHAAAQGFSCLCACSAGGRWPGWQGAMLFVPCWWCSCRRLPLQLLPPGRQLMPPPCSWLAVAGAAASGAQPRGFAVPAAAIGAAAQLLQPSCSSPSAHPQAHSPQPTAHSPLLGTAEFPHTLTPSQNQGGSAAASSTIPSAASHAPHALRHSAGHPCCRLVNLARTVCLRVSIDALLTAFRQ
jgi:hypothetical protein